MTTQSQRKNRARQACTTCNARRVKCNVTERNPCTNCVAGNITCTLRESRRGKHPRKRSHKAHPLPSEFGQSEGTKRRHTVANAHEDGAEPGQEPSNLESRLSAHSSQVPRLPNNEHASDITQPYASTTCCRPSDTTAVQATNSNSISEQTSPRAWDDPIAASEALVVLSQNEPSEIPAPTVPLDKDTPLETPSSVLSTIRSQGHVSTRSIHSRDEEETVFLGESTSIRYLHNAHPSPVTSSLMKQPFLYPVPQDVRAENLSSEWEAERKQARIKFLESQGAFSFPPRWAVDKLLAAYFQWFHPCFVIVDESDIWEQHQCGTLSPLLLQAILFIGVIHCDEEDLSVLGLGSRHRAKYVLYNRTKDLFDAEIEQRALTVIQALFLMSFWRAGALLQKDTRHWLGAAVSMAQTKALHRSSRGTHDKIQRIRKRLWWSIYIRERQCAAALGLPNRIRDEDCDVESLEEADFEYAFGSSTSPTQARESITYMVGLVELSRVLGRIIHHDFLPSKHLTNQMRDEIRDHILKWRGNLPDFMQLSSSSLDNSLGFHASMLHLAWNNLLILLYRSGCGKPDSSQAEKEGGQVALQAAARNTSIIENMMAEGYMRHGQIHVITNIFNTLCIHTLGLRYSEGSRRRVAEHRAKLCLLALRELQEIWEVKNWILQVFFQYLDQSTAARLQLSDETPEAGASQKQAGRPQRVPAAASPDAPPNCRDGNIVKEHSFSMYETTEAPWNSSSVDVVGQFLYSQIENHFVNGDCGAIDWNMADLFDTELPSV